MKSILNKLHNIMSEVGSLEKDKENILQNYEYLSEANVKHAIQPLLVKHGVVFQVQVKFQAHQIIGQTKSGNDILKTDADILYSFYDIESGEVLSGTFIGSGADAGDKGLYKAITGAIKYILTSTFLIPTGDDPENDSKEVAKPVVKTTAPAPTTQTTTEDAGKSTAIKVLYGVLNGKGLDPKTYVTKLAALHGKGTIGAMETKDIVNLAKDIRNKEISEINAMFDENLKRPTLEQEFDSFFENL